MARRWLPFPLRAPPSSTGSLTALEVLQSAPDTDNFGDRLRGYITAPSTGAFQFFLTGDEAAELWISNDEEPANLFKRAALSAPTGLRAWANASVSPLLWMEVGRRYYVEVLRKEGTGTDHVSVGWIKPGQTVTVPSEVVPGYALSPWVVPVTTAGDSTLYTTNMSSQGDATSNGSGSATLKLSADQTEAVLSFSYTNLSTPVTNMHVHDGTLPATGNILFDIDAAVPREDGSYVWPIADVPGIGVTAAQIIQHLSSGSLYLNIHTVNYPAGEIKGFFKLQAASQTFTPPNAPAAWVDDHTDPNAASRFLTQATFGANSTDMASVQSLGYEAWIDDQMTRSATHHLDFVLANKNTTVPTSPTYPTSLTTNAWWSNSIGASDQLRQRVAFALSEILVLSTSGTLEDHATAVSYYYDTLLDKSFGNFRDVLEAVTLNPAMGLYLDMRANDKPNKATGLHPNENYAREIQQLFSVGLNRLHPDGSLMLNSKGEVIPTYDQNVIIGFAHVFTGWNYFQANAGAYLPTSFSPSSDYTHPMREVPSHHFTGPKRILNNVVLPGLVSVAGAALDPYATHTTAQINDPAYQALASLELAATHDSIANHPNTGPFICRELIQRLVTSTPSLSYVYRVAQKFADNGSGVRGDMKAVIKAILLDSEARGSAARSLQGFGKQREPVLRVTALARAFPAVQSNAGTYVQSNRTITVTTSSVHKLATGSVVPVNFNAGSPGPASSGSYSVASVPSTTQFTLNAKDILSGTYSQTGTTLTVTIASHGFLASNFVYLNFTSGAPSAPVGAVYQITAVPTTGTFTVTVGDSVARTGNVFTQCLKGGYTQTGTTVTVSTTTEHDLAVGSTVSLDYIPSFGQSTQPADGVFTVTAILNTRSFTVTDATSASRNGTFVGAQSTPIFTRTGATLGDVNLGLNTWNVGDSDTDIAQTPLRSPTVFNYFVPDFQFPGVIAEAGLVTPEFQLTSDTNVMRQNNFLFGGIFSSTSSTSSGPTTGLNSFKGGGGAMALDFSPWMGVRPTTTTPWTNNENLGALLDQMNTLLLGGQLPTAARTIILNYVGLTTNIAYTNTAPTDTQKRDRIRAIVHLLAVSPDFTIQK